MRLFFPEHDLALANGVKHFNPPRMAIALAQRGESLSPWWQREGEPPLPWGWDWDSREELRRGGVPREELPCDDDLRAIRRLSSREQTIPLLYSMQDICPEIALPERLSSDEALDAYLSAHEAESYVFKSPWSSSGRGLSIHPQQDTPTLRRRGQHVIRQMGCIIAEPWYDKLQDFAMLFFVDRSRQVTFEGYSLFDNDARGTYLRGILASNDQIETRLCELGDFRELLHLIQRRIQDWLQPHFSTLHSPFPVGWIGVDMMVVNLNGRRVIHPCVEMNVRSTMGVVARNMFDRGGKTGFFSFKKSE